ncbi:MAG: hypothetical protein KC656_35560, partial [Myxococcales bacterium]|nr:hypothetical protein [Myxococcales bacterium]
MSGGVKCWGNNASGELGDGSMTGSPVPVGVAGLSSDVLMISAGDHHACAVTTSGALLCWGANDFGQLGDGTTTNSPVPVEVVGLSSGVTSVSAGAEHTCAITSGGVVQCWGNSIATELNAVIESMIPVEVAGLSPGALAVSAGTHHSCVVTAGGALWCWGANYTGGLGRDDMSYSTKPIEYEGLSGGILGVATGQHHDCALTRAGALLCWGLNGVGQLGYSNPPENETPIPVAVPGLSPAIEVTTGNARTCAITVGGAVECFGHGDPTAT